MDDSVPLSMIEAFRQDNYRFGVLQSIAYDRNRVDLFPPGFLGRLYFALQGSRFHKNRPGDGVLEVLFCGMDTSFDSVVSYLARIPLAVMGIWQDDGTFKAAGIHFITTKAGIGEESSCFAGYGFLKEYWGTNEQESLTILGISQIFGELKVKSIHGVRYTANEMTARYMARFGFKDVGTLPDYMLRRGKIVPAVLSTLSRAEFERNLEKRVLEAG